MLALLHYKIESLSVRGLADRCAPMAERSCFTGLSLKVKFAACAGS